MTTGADPVSRDELLKAFAGAASTIGDYFADLDVTAFMDGTPEQWGAAHHLDHLIRSNLPVAGGLSVARERLQPLPPEHRQRTYAEVRDDYRAVLATGVRASGRWLPQPEGRQSELVERYRASLDALRNALEHWSDAELDAWAMPHPALGVLSVREMLFFTLYHNQHHADGVRARLGRVERQAVTGDNDPL